jgi:ferric-chelate reductase
VDLGNEAQETVLIQSIRYDHFLWPTFLVWGMDRLLRLGWIIVNSRGSKASIELLGNDTVRLTMKRNMKWKAGQHAYITVPSVSRLPLESHPFTIASTAGPNSKGENTLMFLIRQRNGFTNHLLARARSCPGDQLNVYIDGPYGSPPDLKRFTTCILIAGGSGISYTLPLLLDLVR